MLDIMREQLTMLNNLKHSVDGKESEETPEDFKEIVWYKNSTDSIMDPSELPGAKKLFLFESYFVKPFEGFDFHEKFNRGVPPPEILMEGEIIKETEKMLYIDCGAGEKRWSGWCPKKCVKIK